MNPCTKYQPSIINLRPANRLFALGKLVATPGAIKMFKAHQLSPFDFVSRHWQGDWGDLDSEDVQANQAALRYGTRLPSCYRIGDDTRLWIITEGDRSVTTLLLPEEY